MLTEPPPRRWRNNSLRKEQPVAHHTADYITATADLSDYYGQPILYRDPTFAANVWATMTASVHPERTQRRRTDMGWDTVTLRDIYIAKGHTVPMIRIDGEFTIQDIATGENVEYAVDEITDEVGSRWHVVLRRVGAGEVGRGQYRG